VKLGQWKLGVNSILGNSAESDNPDLIITVGPITPQEMKLFEPGKTNESVLKGLIDIILPFDRNKQIKYCISGQDTKFRLSGKTHKAYLGINTTL
jgi:predicted component of type VI protein secretion system